MSDLKPYVVIITWDDSDLKKWSEGYRLIPILARSAGSEIDTIIENSFPAGSVGVINVEESSEAQHEMIFRSIHAQECKESGERNRKFEADRNRYKPLQL